MYSFIQLRITEIFQKLLSVFTLQSFKHFFHLVVLCFLHILLGIVKILHGNISNATKACDSLVRDLESRKNQIKKLQDLWHDQQDLSYYSQVFVSHTDLLERLFLGGNSGYVCSCRKLLHFFCFGNIDKFLHLCYHAWIFC